MGNLLLDLLFPRRCVGCGRVGDYICPSCHKTIILRYQLCPECDRPAIDGLTHPRCLRPQGLDGLTSVWRYFGVVKKTIKQIKYSFVWDMAETLISLMPDSIWLGLRRVPSSTVIYPVPLHPNRLNWRGFNQAEKLGRLLSPRLDLPLVDGLLLRQAKRTPQADIAKRENRIQNAKGLFQVNQLTIHNYQQSILLLDDVWTTGATMKEAAKVLKRGGVGKVWGITVAR